MYHLITDFLFDGKELSSFGYIICSFDSVGMENTTVSEIKYNAIKAPFSDTSQKVSVTYDDNLRTTIDICKNTCNSDSMELTTDDIREVTKWLCRKEYKWLQFISDDIYGMDEIYYEAQINIQKIIWCGICIGLKLDIITNRPYGLTHEIITKLSLQNNSLNTISIHMCSDEEGYIYPDMVIALHEQGNLEITNTFDKTTTRITDCKDGEVIHIYGDILQITSSDEDHIISNCFNYQFPRLCNKFEQSVNTFSFNLKCDIEFRYRGVKKVGI